MTSITTNIKHRVRTPGSEHQGQTSISDPDPNLGCTCILSSGVQEEVFPSASKRNDNAADTVRSTDSGRSEASAASHKKFAKHGMLLLSEKSMSRTLQNCIYIYYRIYCKFVMSN